MNPFRGSSRGRSWIAVIGIDRYLHWLPLSSAVRDATGAAAMFRRLGFESIVEPLLDERATGKAIHELVTEDLHTLGPEDSLVLFYAGHGGTRRHYVGDKEIQTGYLIPVDASDSPNKVTTWIELDGWLRAISVLPAKHILVILDACHSGIALDPIVKWRDINSWQETPLSTLSERRSRRIITSALADQVALDHGPSHGHSLFTGCLIEGLTHGLRRGTRRVTTGSELGLYVQQRVSDYPDSRQTPDFGTFKLDDRGEMIIPLATEPFEEAAPIPGMPSREMPYQLHNRAAAWMGGVFLFAVATVGLVYATRDPDQGRQDAATAAGARPAGPPMEAIIEPTRPGHREPARGSAVGSMAPVPVKSRTAPRKPPQPRQTIPSAESGKVGPPRAPEPTSEGKPPGGSNASEPTRAPAVDPALVKKVIARRNMYSETLWVTPQDQETAQKYALLMKDLLATGDAELSCKAVQDWRRYSAADCRWVSGEILELVAPNLDVLNQQCGTASLKRSELMRCAR
jgi:uncharacterized caspase-like protein